MDKKKIISEGIEKRGGINKNPKIAPPPAPKPMRPSNSSPDPSKGT